MTQASWELDRLVIHHVHSHKVVRVSSEQHYARLAVHTPRLSSRLYPNRTVTVPLPASSKHTSPSPTRWCVLLSGEVSRVEIANLQAPQNSLFNSALKQTQLIKRDLDVLSSSPLAASPALQGQISASIASLSRTINDYDTMARRELIPAKKEKAEQRVKNFRKEMAEYRAQFEKLKGQRQEAVGFPLSPFRPEELVWKAVRVTFRLLLVTQCRNTR